MNTAVDDIVEVWQQRWPVLRLAYLYGSPGESERGLLTAVLALELGAARFALSDSVLASRKLGFWAEEFAAGAHARHPLSKAIGFRSVGMNPAALWIDDLDAPVAEDVAGQLRRWQPIAEALSAATGGTTESALVYPTLWAAYQCLAVAEGLPLATLPLALLAQDRPGPELALPLARQFARDLHPRWATIPASAFHGRRGERVLAMETLHGLGSDHPARPADSWPARWARGWRCWRSASGLN